MKKFFRSILAIVLILLVFVGAFVLFPSVRDFFGTFFNKSELEKLEALGYNEYLATEEFVKLLGRSAFENEKRYLSFSGSGVEFKAQGEYITFEIFAVDKDYQLEKHYSRFAVFVNEKMVLDEMIDFSENKFTVDISGYDDIVTVRLSKLSEALYSSFALGKIGVYSEYKIKPTEEKKLSIEFVGDSITSGYALDETDSKGSFKTQTENFLKTYAYLTAERLDADYSAVSFSGFGVYSGVTSGKRNSKDLVMLRYEEAAKVPQKDFLWDFKKENDLVVVNIGTNDASFFSRNSAPRSLFEDEYIKALKTLREKNPHSYILCILGDMNNSLYPNIEKAVSRYISETKDSRVSVSYISFDMGNTDITVHGHPGPLANVHASKSLYELIYTLIAKGEIFPKE